MIRKNVMLDPETIEILKALGGGNLSEGIRKAAEQSMHQTVAGGGSFWTVIAATAGNANRWHAPLQTNFLPTLDSVTVTR